MQMGQIEALRINYEVEYDRLADIFEAMKFNMDTENRNNNGFGSDFDALYNAVEEKLLNEKKKT